MNKHTIKTAGVFLLAIMMATAINAQPNRQGNWGSAYLDLSDEQSEQITELRTEHYNTMKPLRAKMAEIRAKERTLLSEESVDQDAVEKVIDEQTDLLNQIRKLQIKHQLAVKELLTDEQVMKLEQRQRHPARRGQARFGRGQGPGTGYGKGYQRGDERRYGRSFDRGYGRSFDRGYGRSFDRNFGPGYNRGNGRSGRFS